MSALLLVTSAAWAAKVVFWILAAAGLASAWRRGGLFRYRGFRKAQARAAQRFALGEIDSETYRRFRRDLVRGARP